MKRIARAAAITVLVLQSLPALAEGGKPNIKLGQLALHPYYGIKATYDDNIYLVPRANGRDALGGDVKNSWIWTNNVGLGLDLPVGDMHKFKAAYDMRYDAYTRDPSANNAVSQKADASYDFKGSKSKARVFDSYLNTRDPMFNPAANIIGGELNSRQARWQNTAGVSGEYFLADKFFIGADAQDTVQKYLDSVMSAQLNRSEASFGFKTGYKIQPKTRAYVAVHRAITHYSAGKGTDHVTNHKDWLVDFGMEGELAPKLKGQVQTGMVYRQHDKDASSVGTYAQQHPIARGWTVMLGLDYKPTDVNTIKLRANRGLVDAVAGGNYYITNGAAIEADHKWRKALFGVNAGFQIDKYSETTNVDRTNAANAPIPVGGVTRNRRDDTYTLGLKTNYNFTEWLAANCNYQHMAKYSIFSHQFNYKDNRISLEAKVTF